MSVGELAAYLSSHLRTRGIDTILSGGSCAAVYSQGTYVSKDLDFIETMPTTFARMRDAMRELGFEYEGSLFKHPDTAFVVDFPKGPPSIGKAPVENIHELKFSTGVLRLLSPTDCVKDRLAAYYHWEDRQCLEQAVLVARNHPINLRDIRQWSMHEGKSVEFAEIAHLLG